MSFACVSKQCKSRELEMFLFCLWNKLTVSIMRLSVFYFSACKTELELKLFKNFVQILGKVSKDLRVSVSTSQAKSEISGKNVKIQICSNSSC